MRSDTVLFWIIAPASLFALGAGACGGSSSGSHAAGSDGGDDSGITVEAGGDAPSDVATSEADVGPDADNGAPSTNYPAPHPPMPKLVNGAGGPVLTAPKVYLVVYPGYPYQTDLVTFAQKMTTATYWSTVTGEYGVGALSYGGVITLTGQTPPGTISSTALETWVEGQIQSGAFGTPDPQAIYTLFFPSGTTITQPNPVIPGLPGPQSCTYFTGYHNNAIVTPGDGGAPANYAYAVIPTCTPDANSLTSVVSHEWVEASTDPHDTASGAFALTAPPQSAFFSADPAHIIWDLPGGGEAGDLCEPENGIFVTPPDVGYSVQRTWSNLQAQSSHDPCAPDVPGAFFDSAPVLPETVTFTSSLTGSITSQGITIPVGSSKTIEVDLFSDGDTGGPWTVAAADLMSTNFGSYGLTPSMTFQWDRAQGQNGEKLHLTITVTATSGSLLGGAHAFMITSTKGSRSTVWPGIVVE